MNTALLTLSRICLAWIVVYVIFSIVSGLWAGARHNQGLLLLELHSHRARGSREIVRARTLKRMALLALLALPVGIAAFIASAVLS
ncbi:hypothetical protein [Burkholderia pseudomultivorans]|uniref:Transmembrane protein n=1 Tax=Burkholderia pseudomultivorans TaxID=1207504 RepID=A0A132F7W1_9BURK|nr:hypothetical protein [Burkholderia pseudomultivorans]KWF12772.1 hypothetical protein WT55_05765 [Burkholderia pseudomultivorans]KWF72270.1 hypothetical protein WT57_06610 [Burkholderia pseudomultivorans]KWI58554.1 hypothetical protein WT72_00175 [Burkholderia pseudomultivorans]MBF5011895.1 hypothetical protein [Burkholderia pseudomultivorans]